MASSLSSWEVNPGASSLHNDDTPVASNKHSLPVSLPITGSTTNTGGHVPTMLDSVGSEGTGRGDGAVRRGLSRLLHGKEEEWAAVTRRDGPLRLLDLPMDILKEIVKEVTHTNDLTALALTHSALHNLAIPHIYSRFDIVWPDATSSAESRTGVDALTYGLATLVMGQNVFGQCPGSHSDDQHTATCSRCGSSIACTGGRPGKRRLGNNYPQYTRKFSLGNGPADWVQEYMITKESGKMLGTLVALAVARMVNLETFIWDMPTGVLRDVWLALSSLQDKVPPGECRLERVLVRWHDNSADPTQSASSPNTSSVAAGIYYPPGTTMTAIGIVIPGANSQMSGNTQHYAGSSAQMRVEHPTFSVLPPLKSLSVLDIDDVAYLDEMSILIGKSKDRLRELRVGISRKAEMKDFVLSWDGPGLQQVDHHVKWPAAPVSIGDKRLGGVLGILVGRICDIRKKTRHSPGPERNHANQNLQAETQPAANEPTAMLELIDLAASIGLGPAPTSVTSEDLSNGSQLLVHSSSASSDAVGNSVGHVDLAAHMSATITSPATELTPTHGASVSYPVTARSSLKPKIAFRNQATETASRGRTPLDGKLRLTVLELERVPLSVAVLQKAFDWTTITSLTILDCAYHENLWKMLRRQFQPHMSPKSALATSSYVRNSISANSASKPITNVPLEYQLSLKKLHTDFVTPALLAFLKETLAPNTLEVLFLQDRRRNTPTAVSISEIHRGPLKRHRRSLKKLLIDSSDKTPRAPSSASDSGRWKTWMLSHAVLSDITSGSFSSLRELSIAIEYKDWHFFLRRLPQVSTLRSLNIPYIADHVTPAYDPRELAMQVVDMIFLRPEIELCYLGISNKCFEILENKHHEDSGGAHDAPNHTGHTTDDDDEDEDEEVDEDDDDDDDDEAIEDDHGTAAEAVEVEGMGYETSDPGDSDVESSIESDDGRPKFSLKLREILFYDDKVAIFKARHMRL